ncbi:MAG: DUF4097 family beta strand repeat-containing protein [Acidobacteriota bacterium]|nr:DUF4097 family beta strand repeat-containing protein [Acidobacteriota bacterium]
MKSLVTCLMVCALALTISAAPARAGFATDSSDENCSANHSWGDAANFAQTRQERLQSSAVNYIDPGQNGSIRVHAWDNADVLVKACVQTSAPTDSEARDLASKVRITNGAGHIEASGPSERGRRNWSVSYDIWMPANSGTKLTAFNGSITVDGLHGRIRFHTLNGSVRLLDVGGDVDGDTTNGSVTVSVASTGRYAGGLRLETTNGSVKLELPENYSAKVEASTVNGSIKTDFPVTVSGEIGKHLSFTLDSGGPEIDAKTTNGSIHITRRA